MKLGVCRAPGTRVRGTNHSAAPAPSQTSPLATRVTSELYTNIIYTHYTVHITFVYLVLMCIKNCSFVKRTVRMMVAVVEE